MTFGDMDRRLELAGDVLDEARQVVSRAHRISLAAPPSDDGMQPFRIGYLETRLSPGPAARVSELRVLDSREVEALAEASEVVLFGVSDEPLAMKRMAGRMSVLANGREPGIA